MKNLTDREDILPVIGVRSSDTRLIRKLELALLGRATTISSPSPDSIGGLDLLIVDRRAAFLTEEDRQLPTDARTIFVFDRWDEAAGRPDALPYPFRFSELFALIFDTGRTHGGAKRLFLEGDGRHARLDGERIRLTESEYKLLSLLIAGGGEFATREELTLGTFGEGVDGGSLNVYIHYLREKLERGGEKIILSSRKLGYRIDAKFLGGEK